MLASSIHLNEQVLNTSNNHLIPALAVTLLLFMMCGKAKWSIVQPDQL